MPTSEPITSALVKPRLTDYHGILVAQKDCDFAIPYLDEDIPLYVDPFLLWRSPSLQDQSLHASILTSFNFFGSQFLSGKKDNAIESLKLISECEEVGLGISSSKAGKRIGDSIALEVLELFSYIPQIKVSGFRHIEESQLYVSGIGKDRISDFTCSLLKSFLIDYTIEQCKRTGIPLESCEVNAVFDFRSGTFATLKVNLPVNPIRQQPIIFVPKRWLRLVPWINFDAYYSQAIAKSEIDPSERASVLTYNRDNYGVVDQFVTAREAAKAACQPDPLFSSISITSAKSKLRQILQLPSGKSDNADKKYEDLLCGLLPSLLHPNLDFAEAQSRIDSGSQIRDLIFYNTRESGLLEDLYRDYESKQIVFELKNVKELERDHINQLNRYLAPHFGRFGVIVTRNAPPKSIVKNIIDLWSGQRKCLLVLTDAEISTMVQVFETKQRLPLEVLTMKFVEFQRQCPS